MSCEIEKSRTLKGSDGCLFYYNDKNTNTTIIKRNSTSTHVGIMDDTNNNYSCVVIKVLI